MSAAGSGGFFSNKVPFEETTDESVAKKRDNFMAGIRKNERSKRLNKKRFINELPSKLKTKDLYHYLRNSPDCDKYIAIIDGVVNDQQTRLEDLNSYVELVRNGDLAQKLEGLVRIRKLLSIRKNTPIQQVMDTNVVIDLVNIAKSKEDVLRVECTWCLTNIATGTNLQVHSLVEKGIIPLYVQLLKENSFNLAEQVIWGIGNIAGDCHQFRDMLLQHGAMEAMVSTYRQIRGTATDDLIRSLVWAAGNLCRLKPAPSVSRIYPGLEVFSECFVKLCQKQAQSTVVDSSQNKLDFDCMVDCVWSMVAIVSMENISAIYRQINLLPYLIKCLSSPQLILCHPCLRILGIYSNSEDEICQAVIDNGALPQLRILLSHQREIVRKEASWIISNMTAGSTNQIAEVFKTDGILDKLFMMAASETTEVKREAIWAICNSVKNSTPSQFQRLINDGMLNMINSLVVKDQDTKILNVVLEALYSLLQFGDEHYKNSEGENLILHEVEEMGLGDKLEELQMHPHENVYRKAMRLLKAFWEEEDPF